MKNQPTYALKNMVKALGMHSWLNTKEENERLEVAKIELKQRKNRVYNRKDRGPKVSRIAF